MRRGQRIARAAANARSTKSMRDARDQFEAGDAGAEALRARLRNSASACAGLGEADEGGRTRARAGEQLQRRGGDDAERAFGADEQVLEIVAGIVLAQLRQRVDDAPVGEHDLDAGRRDRARCRRRAPRRRRRWSRDCRRSCRSPRTRATAETAGRRVRAAACASASVTPASTIIALASGSISRTRFSRCSDSTISGRWRRESGRRPGRCCRPAARSATRRLRRAATTARDLRASNPAAPAPAPCPDRARAARPDAPAISVGVGQHMRGADDAPPAGENSGDRARIAHPRTPFARASPARPRRKTRDDLDMGRVAELVNRRHAFEPKPASARMRGVAREGPTLQETATSVGTRSRRIRAPAPRAGARRIEDDGVEATPVRRAAAAAGTGRALRGDGAQAARRRGRPARARRAPPASSLDRMDLVLVGEPQREGAGAAEQIGDAPRALRSASAASSRERRFARHGRLQEAARRRRHARRPISDFGGRRSMSVSPWLERRARSKRSAAAIKLGARRRRARRVPRRSTSRPASVAVTTDVERLAHAPQRRRRGRARRRARRPSPGASSGQASISMISCARARMKPTSTRAPSREQCARGTSRGGVLRHGRRPAGRPRRATPACCSASTTRPRFHSR